MRPHLAQADRDLLDDLGLVSDDQTEDLRLNSRTAPEPQVRQHLAGAAQTHSPAREEG